MANAKIELLGVNDLDLIAQLYNQVFKPAHNGDFFKRRFLGRHNPLVMTAVLDGHPVGFALGFELKPFVFFAWLYGVLPDFRRAGVASQMVEAMQAWAREHEYHAIRMECHNQHRPMLHLMIGQGYDIVGMRWDPDRGDNLVIFEKSLI